MQNKHDCCFFLEIALICATALNGWNRRLWDGFSPVRDAHIGLMVNFVTLSSRCRVCQFIRMVCELEAELAFQMTAFPGAWQKKSGMLTFLVLS